MKMNTNTDKLWCEALIAHLDTDQIQKVTKTYLGLRDALAPSSDDCKRTHVARAIPSCQKCGIKSPSGFEFSLTADPDNPDADLMSLCPDCAKPKPAHIPLSDEAKAMRQPPPPADRISDPCDPVHRDAGPSRVAKSVKPKPVETPEVPRVKCLGCLMLIDESWAEAHFGLCKVCGAKPADGGNVTTNSRDAAVLTVETDASKRYEEGGTRDDWKWTAREAERQAREFIEKLKVQLDAVNKRVKELEDGVFRGLDWKSRAEEAEKRVKELEERTFHFDALVAERKKHDKLTYDAMHKADLAERRLEIAREGLEKIGAYRSSSQADVANETLKRIDGAAESGR